MSGDDVHPLVRRILSSPGGRRLLELTDAEMGRFLTSAESVLLLREEEGDDSIRETIKRLREGRSATTRSVNLVYEGAGVHGIALIGALSALEERGFAVERAAGASAGALIAVLSAAGYSADEMRQVYLDVDFRHFQDRGWQDRVPLIGRTLSVVMDQGIFEGRMLLEW